MASDVAPDQAKAPLFAPTQEVRFAVVLYGGVSLAVYINGIVQELLHLVVATAPEVPSAKLAQSPDVRADIAEPEGTGAVYRKLGQMLGADGVQLSTEPGAGDPIRTRFVVDVLSGSSAGGLNAVYLGKALANEQPLEGLKKLWADEADIARLVNDRDSLEGLDGLKLTRPARRSLLNANRMYWMLLEALAGMDGDGSSPPKDSKYVDELDCWITATDIHGLHVPIKLYDGSVDEKKHRNVFRFLYRSSHASGDPEDIHSDFKRDDNPFLAFAARCSSGFPFAFDPMELEDVNGIVDKPQFADTYGALGTQADWTRFYGDYVRGDELPENARLPFTKRPFGDGGYLDNKPFTWATDNISRRRADYPVDRRLIYLEPAPDRLDPKEPIDRPDALENAQDALVSLPRYETIREDIERLLDQNAQVARLKDVSKVVDLIVAQPKQAFAQLGSSVWTDRRLADWEGKPGLVRERGFQWAAYHRLQVAGVLDDLAELVTLLLGFDGTSDVYLAVRAVVQAWFAQVYETEQDPRGRTQTSFLLDFDLAYRLRRLNFVDERIERMLRQGSSGLAQSLYVFEESRGLSDGEWEQFRATLRELKPPLNDVFVRLRRAGRDLRRLRPDTEVGGPILALLGQLDLGGPSQLVNAVLGDRRSPAEGVAQASRLVSDDDRRAKLTELADLIAKAVKPTIDAARTRVSAVLGQAATEPTGSALARAVVKHYYDEYESYDAVVFPLSYGAAGDAARVEVIRFSPADAKRLIDEERDPHGRRKLGGASVGHFGGFLKASWRVNDMMWGRLDAAERLIDTLLPRTVAADVRDRLIRDAHRAIVHEERSAVFPDKSGMSDDELLDWIHSEYSVDLNLDQRQMRTVARRSLGVTRGVLGGLSAGGHRPSAPALVVAHLARPVLWFVGLSLWGWLPAVFGLSVAAALIAAGDATDTDAAARVGWALVPLLVLLTLAGLAAAMGVRGFFRAKPPPTAEQPSWLERVLGRVKKPVLAAVVVTVFLLVVFDPIALLNETVRAAMSFLPGWS